MPRCSFYDPNTHIPLHSQYQCSAYGRASNTNENLDGQTLPRFLPGGPARLLFHCLPLNIFTALRPRLMLSASPDMHDRQIQHRHCDVVSFLWENETVDPLLEVKGLETIYTYCTVRVQIFFSPCASCCHIYLPPARLGTHLQHIRV